MGDSFYVLALKGDHKNSVEAFDPTGIVLPTVHRECTIITLGHLALQVDSKKQLMGSLPGALIFHNWPH